jgi:catechol 2,3-dioxygenase-like lactoylglutathione lyase family enzyme
MLTRIDHIMICLPDLDRGIETYRRLGFDVQPGGVHPGRGTHNAIAFHREDYLELLSVRDADEYRRGGGGGLLDFIAAGGGLRYIALQSDDLAADVAAMRARGVDVGDPGDGERRTPAGQTLRWRSASLGPRNPLPIFFLQHLTPLAERRGRARAHPNGIVGVERVYINVADVARTAETYARVLGMPVPKIQRGAVIKADMAVFDLGPTGLTVAQPMEPGPAADALARRGPGPFQALHRTTSMEAAATWMADHGVPPPARGIRNTGEEAMLVGPEHTGGLYVGFVGPR